MHVELIYSPGCNEVKSTLQILETIIAEERLPIPVEVRKDRRKEASRQDELMITVDGMDVSDFHQGGSCDNCNSYREHTGFKKALCIEHLRDVLWHKWKDLTEHSLQAVRRRA